MANSITADFAEIWAKEQQLVFRKENVATAFADVSYKSQLSKGDTLNRPYRQDIAVSSYTRGTSITIEDLTDTQEQLSVNKQYAHGFYMDDFDKIQSNYDLIANYAKDQGIALSNQVDADVLGEYVNATSTVDDGTIGGTSGNGIALTTSNILSVISAAKKKLAKLNIPLNSLFGVISPEFEDILVQYSSGRDTGMGDAANSNGFVRNLYGFDLYMSNQTAGSASLSLATNPTNTDTVTIAGQDFTFVSTIGTTAGNVLIAGTVDGTRANLETLINAPGTTTANGVALTGTALKTFANNISAVNNDTTDTLAVVQNGVGAIALEETLTDATDTWTATKTKQHLLFGAKKAPTLVVQSDPKVRVRDVETKLGVNVLNGVLYGVKTFADQAKMLVNVEIKASGF